VSRAQRLPAALLALALAAGLAPPAARAAAADTLRVTIAFTGDASGYLEPCG
jgi:hypothetical protein